LLVATKLAGAIEKGPSDHGLTHRKHGDDARAKAISPVPFSRPGKTRTVLAIVGGEESSPTRVKKEDAMGSHHRSK
jgi:hypothetical protein